MGKQNGEQGPLMYAPFEKIKKRLKRRVRREEPFRERPPEEAPEASTDEELFRLEMADAEPVAGRERIGRTRDGASQRKNSCPVPEDVESSIRLTQVVTGEAPMDPWHSDEYVAWASRDLSPKSFSALKEGRFSVQAHLDLHGLTTEEAERALVRFVIDSSTKRLRCVLVVHGRGLNSRNFEPVLKKHVQVWLRRGRCGKRVRAYASAQGYDGGLGALYVLLR